MLKPVCRAFSSAALAFCGTNATAAPPKLSYELGAVSDYRFRGASLSDGRPAVQGSVAFGQDNGFYASAWGSTIEKTSGGARVELDAVAGYRLQPVREVTLDVSGTYYVYPGDAAINYFEVNASASVELGAFTPSVGVSFVPMQRATRDPDGHGRSNLYLFGRGEVDLPAVPCTLIGSFGYERGYFDLSESGGKSDWLLGIELTREPLRASLSYVGTDAKLDAEGSRHGVVGSIFLQF